MKKRIIVCLCLICVLCCSSCNKTKVVRPSIEDAIRNSAKIATLEVITNNVADHTNTAGIFKDKKYWMEYKGFVKYGIDIDKLAIDRNGNTISIVFPEIEMVDSGVYSINNEDIIEIKGLIDNVTPEQKDKAKEEAQLEMEEKFSNDSEMKKLAENRTKTIIKQLVEAYSESDGVQYTIVWK